MSRKQKSQKSIKQPVDPIAKEIRALERKLDSAKRERDAKRQAQQKARDGFYADLQKEVAPLNTEINRIESALFETRARYRSISGGGDGVASRGLHGEGQVASGAVAMVPGAVDEDGSGRVVKAPTVAQTQDILSRSRLITGPELATAREFQALFQQCCYGDIRAANLERVGGGSRPMVIDFVEDRRDMINRLFRLMGGMYSPMGSILFHVVGMEESIVAWCARQASDGKRQWSPDKATGLLAAAISHLHVIWSFRHIVVIEDAVRGQLLKVGHRQGVPA